MINIAIVVSSSADSKLVEFCGRGCRALINGVSVSHILTSAIRPNFQANSRAACGRACQIESEFLCRSFLYLGPPTGTDYNCKLYHMDHYSLPSGLNRFITNNNQYIDDGSRIGTYYENRCESKS